MIKFCGFTIKPLKVVKDVKEDKIILSTWSQPASVGGTLSIYASDVSEFLDGFIGNIETFNFKIQKYTSNPSKWVYRVYIDETYLNAKELIDNLIDIDKEIKDNKYKKEHSKEYTKTNHNIINDFDPLYNDKKQNIIHSYTAYISREQVLKRYINLNIRIFFLNILGLSHQNNREHYCLHRGPLRAHDSQKQALQSHY